MAARVIRVIRVVVVSYVGRVWMVMEPRQVRRLRLCIRAIRFIRKVCDSHFCMCMCNIFMEGRQELRPVQKPTSKHGYYYTYSHEETHTMPTSVQA